METTERSLPDDSSIAERPMGAGSVAETTTDRGDDHQSDQREDSHDQNDDGVGRWGRPGSPDVVEKTDEATDQEVQGPVAKRSRKSTTKHASATSVEASGADIVEDASRGGSDATLGDHRGAVITAQALHAQSVYEDSIDELPMRGKLLVYRFYKGIPERLALCHQISDKGSKIVLSNSNLTAYNERGYRMVRATMGSPCGIGYFEVSFDGGPFGGSARIGVSSHRGDVDGPVGYDKYSYSYASKTGNKFHRSKGSAYGMPWETKAGSVVGVLVRLPDWSRPPEVVLREEETSLNQRKKAILIEEEEVPEMEPSSSIEFFLNGISQGVAYTGLTHVTWYPAVSMYGGASCTVNFGPDFKYNPVGVRDAHLILPWCDLVRRNPAYDVAIAQTKRKHLNHGFR